MENWENIVINGLQKTFLVHESLGQKGRELVHKNQFAETALRLDIECEKAIIDLLKEKNVPIRIISEEHRVVNVTKDPKFLGVLDGLDGSNVYQEKYTSARYGTMFAIFNSTDPHYQDYLVCGIMEHPAQKLFFAVKDQGAFLIRNGKKQCIHVSPQIQLNNNTRIYLNDHFEINRKIFSRVLKNFGPKLGSLHIGSTAVHYADLVCSDVDLVMECTRKNNLEIAVAYGLVKEAGGVMVDLKGNDIGDKKYLQFSQKGHISIIAAATEKLVENLLKYIKQK